MSTLDSPVALSDIESVLAWVDTFKLSRPTRKINRDFSDAVLLAEILSVHYPKLVEMHNYPPRNSHALKLNNWMTLNRKVLKKLKLNLCCNTMEQLANCSPGVIERVLIMVRDKIRHDEDLNKSGKDSEQNMSSGGSYYEACGDDEHVLVVPVKTRVNGILETIQQKVVSYDSYQTLKEEHKDAKESMEQLKQKVDHLNDLLKLKDERIDELQNQLERKQVRRKEVETLQNSLGVPFDIVQSPVVSDVMPISRKSSLKMIESKSKIAKEESKIPIPKVESTMPKAASKPSITEVSSIDIVKSQIDNVNINEIEEHNIEKVKSNIFQDVISIDDKPLETIKKNEKYTKDIEQNIDNIKKEGDISPDSLEIEEFKDSSQDAIITIDASIKKEIKEIITPSYNEAALNYIM